MNSTRQPCRGDHPPVYDSLNRLTNLTHSLGGTNLLASYSYQLHPTGRRTNAVEILKTEDTATPYITNTLSWAYDGMYRLTNEVSISTAPSGNGTYTNAYQYDQVGNRFAKVHSQYGGTTTITNLYNENDQLLKEVTLTNGAPAETNWYAYDANGSVIARTNVAATTTTTLYGYDLKNKLSSVTTAGGVETNFFLYNDQGIRVRTTSSAGGNPTLYLVDANNHTGYAHKGVRPTQWDLFALARRRRAVLIPVMPRKPRVQYPGAIYHVMSRGDRREDIFLTDVDRQDFLKTLAEACEKTGWQVHAYCLMGNHFHLVVETPNANLVAGMKWLLSAYTIRLNHRHKLFGHVFSGRYKALVLDGSGTGYLRTACDYVHLNPVRAKLLRKADRLLAYPWSTFPLYLAAPEHRPSWVRTDRLLGGAWDWEGHAGRPASVRGADGAAPAGGSGPGSLAGDAAGLVSGGPGFQEAHAQPAGGKTGGEPPGPGAAGDGGSQGRAHHCRRTQTAALERG